MDNAGEVYRYVTGEKVIEGDVVESENRKIAIVEKIISPDTAEAEDFSCPMGGILLREDWDGKPSLLLLPAGAGGGLEDTVFLRRGSTA